MSLAQRLRAGLARRLGAWPLAFIGQRSRAEVLGNATDAMIESVETAGGPIRFHVPSSLLLARAESLLTKEIDTIVWLDGLEPGSVLWDLGANVGAFSLYAATSGRVRVLAFEPLAANFHVLCRNIQLNACEDRVTAYCLAFAERTGLGILNVGSAAMGAAMTQFGRAGEVSRYWEGPVHASQQGMLGYALDDFIERFAPAFPTHLKIDVDGLELPILLGARATLRDTRLRSVMLELTLSHADELARAVTLLEASGLRLVSRGEIQGTRTEKAANHLFARS